MVPDVFPVAARLVAAPDARIALRAGPAVERDDERAGVRTVVRHDFAHVGHTVEAEAVARADPGHVGLQHAHTCVAHFLHDVALEEGLDAFLRVEVTLRPEADFHALRTGIVAKFLQVLDVAVERARLAVAGSVAVVGEEPSEGHVVVEVAVDGGPGRELVVVLLAVEAFAHAAVVLLTFVVALAVLVEHEAVFGGCPVVAVVGVEVSLVEAELREQHGVTRQLVEVVEQFHGTVVHHEEGIEVVLGVGEDDLALLRLSEVVAAGAESVPEQAVALCAPEEGSGRGHTAVHPVVGVFDGDGLSLVRETAVLHAATVEIFAAMLLEGQRGGVFVERNGGHFFHYDVACLQVLHAHGAVRLVERHGDARRSHHDLCALVLEVHLHGRAARTVHEDLCGRLSHRVAHDAAVVVAEKAEDIFAVEVNGEHFAVGKGDFYGRRIDFLGFHDSRLCVVELFDARGKRQGMGRERSVRQCASSQGQRIECGALQPFFRLRSSFHIVSDDYTFASEDTANEMQGKGKPGDFSFCPAFINLGDLNLIALNFRTATIVLAPYF